jgi:hypothetical protein
MNLFRYSRLDSFPLFGRIYPLDPQPMRQVFFWIEGVNLLQKLIKSSETATVG